MRLTKENCDQFDFMKFWKILLWRSVLVPPGKDFSNAARVLQVHKGCVLAVILENDQLAGVLIRGSWSHYISILSWQERVAVVEIAVELLKVNQNRSAQTKYRPTHNKKRHSMKERS